MNSQIKAIETQYKGYRFRSRLEARWAVFFDALGIKWEYEPEGFELPDGTRYLPDFFLPKFDGPDGLYVEVKPDYGDEKKAEAFAKASGKSLLMAVGTPGPMTYTFYWTSKEDYDATPNEFRANTVCFVDKYITGSHSSEYRLYGEPGYEESDGSISRDEMQWNPGVLAAIDAARSARFEHGESGARA